MLVVDCCDAYFAAAVTAAAAAACRGVAHGGRLWIYVIPPS